MDNSALEIACNFPRLLKRAIRYAHRYGLEAEELAAETRLQILIRLSKMNSEQFKLDYAMIDAVRILDPRFKRRLGYRPILVSLDEPYRLTFGGEDKEYKIDLAYIPPDPHPDEELTLNKEHYNEWLRLSVNERGLRISESEIALGTSPSKWHIGKRAHSTRKRIATG